MSRLVSLLEFLESLWRHRVFRGVMWSVAALIAFDRAVYAWTEYQWFASIGFQSLWWTRTFAQFLLFGTFLLVCWGLARLFLAAVTQFKADGPPLRGALLQVEPLRRRVARWAWFSTGLVALILARDFASHWRDWLFLRGGFTSHFSPAYSPNSRVWTHFLPVLAPLLSALWLFSLYLLLIVALTGILRALPLLAARDKATPLLLPRVLWRLGAWLLFLRGLAYIVQILNLNRGRPLQSGDVFIAAPLFALGALCCFVLTVRAVRMPRKNSRLGFGIGVALLLPEILFLVSAPVRSRWGETNWIRSQRTWATRAAWKLTYPEMSRLPAAPPIEMAWPVWDEKSVLQTRLHFGLRSEKRVVTWQSATLNLENGRWGALMVGQTADARVWSADSEADDNNRLALEKVRFDAGNEISPVNAKTQAAYYGFEGRTLFSNQPIGVPFRNWANKFLWAWRLRDVLLPFEGAPFSYLLVFRGTAERAEKLAPFWTVSGEPRLVLDGQRPVWILDMCATTSNFPGAMVAPAGALQGTNAASDNLKMLMDARTGEVSFATSQTGTLQGDGLIHSWSALFPHLIRSPDKLSHALRLQLQASPEMLRVQVAMESALRGDQTTQIIGPQESYDSNGGRVSRVLALGKGQWRAFASWHDGEHTLQTGQGDLEARLSLMDAAIPALPSNANLQKGEPFLWPAMDAPDGWWIGRAYFEAPPNQNAHLWRVALTGINPTSKIGVGTSVEAAYLTFALVNPANPRLIPKPTESPLETQALQANDALQKAVQAGDWVTFGRESAKLRAILQKMVARQRGGVTNVPAK